MKDMTKLAIAGGIAAIAAPRAGNLVRADVKKKLPADSSDGTRALVDVAIDLALGVAIGAAVCYGLSQLK